MALNPAPPPVPPVPLRTALRDAVHTFLLARQGWRVATYTLPVHPDYGRNVGTLSRRLPTYPPDSPPTHPPPTTWGLSSHGDSFPEMFPSPLAAVRSVGRAMATIRERYARFRP